MTALLKLDGYTRKGHRVTLISPSPYHYYSGMGPGLLAGTYEPQQVRFHIRKMVEARGATFVSGRVEKISAEDRLLHLDDGRSIRYDVASFNTGSKVPMGGMASRDETVVPVKPVINLYRARLAMARLAAVRPLDIAVVGGGPAGVEVAANAWRLMRDNGAGGNISLIAGKRALAGFPPRAYRLVKASLAKRGIEVIEGKRAVELSDHEVILSDGRRLPFDFALVATGVTPSDIFKTSEIPTGSGGGLLVNGYLQSVAHPELFGGGDCIELEGRALAKVGVHAVRQNPVLQHNLMAALEGGEMKTFEPSEDYMLILNLGDGRGLLNKKGWVVDGWLAFLLKDYVDKRFMRRFQVSGELAEGAFGDCNANERSQP